MRAALPARLLVSILALLTMLGIALPALAAPLTARTRVTATPATFYASVGTTGIFKSTTLTASWQASATSLPDDVLALAVGDVSRWRLVYAGLKDGGGVYISHDSGNSWAPSSLHSRTVYALLVSPRKPHEALAATDRGIYRSQDDGATWTLTIGVSQTVTALAQAPASPSTIYAGGAGMAWVSRDGGGHWSAFRAGLSSRATIAALAVDLSDPTMVYAATSQGLWRSRNDAWALLNKAPAKVFTGVVVTPSCLCAVTSAGTALYLSTDRGASWSSHTIQKLSSGATALAQDPLYPETLLVGDANGLVSLSMDSGLDWSPQSATVAGTIGSPVLALAIAHRPMLPVDGVPDPNQAGVRWFADKAGDGLGHTLRGAFLAYWQTNPTLIGFPQTEEFTDTQRGNVTAQYFDRMELLLQGNEVVPAPLGQEQLPITISATATYTIDTRFKTFYAQHGGMIFFGPPVSPAFKATNGDGTGRAYLVQYFRNARLEYHPEVPGGAVEGGLLGEQSLQARGWL